MRSLRVDRLRGTMLLLLLLFMFQLRISSSNPFTLSIMLESLVGYKEKLLRRRLGGAFLTGGGGGMGLE